MWPEILFYFHNRALQIFRLQIENHTFFLTFKCITIMKSKGYYAKPCLKYSSTFLQKHLLHSLKNL